eukprot:186122_1
MALDVGQIMDIGILPKGMRRRKSQSTAQIYIDELMEEYTCPICFDEINRCMMTQCGHNFCKECIEECLNRKHICPLCATKATADKLVRNVHLDSVLAKLVAARQAASQQLVQNLMQKTIEESSKNSKITTESPIAQIFTKYTSQTLVKYENYYQEMMRDHNKTQIKLQEKLRVELTSSIKPLQELANKIKKQLQPKQPGGGGGDGNDSESDHEIDDIKMKENDEEEMEIEGGGNALNNEVQELFTNILCVEGGNDEKYFLNLKKTTNSFFKFIKLKQEQLSLSNLQINEIESNISAFNAEMELAQKRANRSFKLLFESYEEYMKTTGPSPFLLPVSITIRLRGRPQHWELKLNATDHIGAIIEIIKKKFDELGDPIHKFDEYNDSARDDDGKENKIELGILRPLG